MLTLPIKKKWFDMIASGGKKDWNGFGTFTHQLRFVLETGIAQTAHSIILLAGI